MLQRVIGISLAVMLVCSVCAAEAWPDIPASDHSLVSVPGFPNAAAVILHRDGRVFLSEDSRSSYIEVYTRLKVLTQEGVDYGSVQLFSSDYQRVKGLEGRTHLPDGRVVELADDAKFEKKYSDYYGTSIVSCAMPEVVKGAIIEYRYRTYFDSIFYPRLWFFQDEIPTLYSQVSFEIPHNIAFAPLVYKTLANVRFEQDSQQTVSGGRLTYTAYNLPPVPDEPARFPFRDLAYRVLLLPTSRRDVSGPPIPLFDNWKDAVEVVWGYRTWGYSHFLSDAGNAKKQAKQLAGSGSKLAKAKAIYRWVRDTIDTEHIGDVWVGEISADEVIKNRKGDLAEKALLLNAMLDAAKIGSNIVWVNPKTRSRVDQNIPNPTQFFRVVVVADVGGKKVFLDPTDRTLAFGSLSPSMQGVPCLIVTKKKQEWSTTPVLAPEASSRNAKLALAVNQEGRVGGSGQLVLTGNHAWERLGWRDTDEESRKAWTEWIEDSYPSFDIDEVTVDEDIAGQKVEVHWSMQQREDEAVEGEVSVLPADPLGLTSNPFTLHPNRRLTPVQLTYGDLDRVETELTWPDGWVIDVEPALGQFSNGAGQLATSIDLDEDAHKLKTVRELTTSKTEYVGAQAYADIKALYDAALKNDSEELILVAE